MIRLVIENLLLFLLPTLIYLAYATLMRGEDKTSASVALNEAPLLWLFGAGALLVVVVLVAFGSTSGGKPGQSYTPPVYRDGRIEPGRSE